ncbi:hypothetical protein ACNKHK_03875 [Shigella flexneri]
MALNRLLTVCFDGSFGFGGEESGGIFPALRRYTVVNRQSGIIMCLLAAEITAVTGKNPQEHYKRTGCSLLAHRATRLQASATSAQKAASEPSPGLVSASTLAALSLSPCV